MKSILTEALEIRKERGEQYGKFGDNAIPALKAFEAYTKIKISLKEFALLMVLVKFGRENVKHGRDNLIDACGYTSMMEELENDDD